MQPLFAEFSAWHYLYTAGLSLLSIFLILVILVQRGRGGGLTGALGGMGGQSAFGTKAGDLFTKITIVVALMWGLAAMATIRFVGIQSRTGGLSGSATTSDQDKSEKKGADDKDKKGAPEPGGDKKSTSTLKAPAEAKPAATAPKTKTEPAKKTSTEK